MCTEYAIQVHWEHGSQEPFNVISPKMISPIDRASAMASTSSGICAMCMMYVCWCNVSFYHWAIHLQQKQKRKRKENKRNHNTYSLTIEIGYLLQKKRKPIHK